MILKRLPKPEQIRHYLARNGWTGEQNPAPDVEIFTYQEPADNGEPITVFVPASSKVFLYTLRVHDVVETVSELERRPKDAVYEALMHTKVDKFV